MARDMEHMIARAASEAVEATQAPLLARIEELTQAVERLSESRQEPLQESLQAAQETVTTIQPPEPLREAQWTPERKPRPLWMVILGYRPKWW
jgi:hypothetical protein